MLKGIRKKVIQNYKKEKERALTENIQYDSIQRFNDKKFLEKKLKKDRNSQFMKNKYKFKDMKSKSLGQYKGGVLNISKNDFKKITGSKR